MLKRNIGIFKGFINEHSRRIVTLNNESLDPKLDLFNHSRIGLDWGYVGSGSLQLSFAILYHIVGESDAKLLCTTFSKDIISSFGNSWELGSNNIRKWIAKSKNKLPTKEVDIYTTSLDNPLNVVKQACKELNITQKKLAEILEIPQGTVSSWAVKNELPRLAKKAIQFYIENKKNEQIAKQFKNLIALVS